MAKNRFGQHQKGPLGSLGEKPPSCRRREFGADGDDDDFSRMIVSRLVSGVTSAK